VAIYEDDFKMSELESPPTLDHSSDTRFKAYYEEKSASDAARDHFVRIRDRALALLAQNGHRTNDLKVLDIGCNAGTQSRVWAQLGHQVTGLDINEPLIQVARERAQADQLRIQFDLGTATKLPYGDASMDVCLLLELLEHVQDWEACVNEAVRVLAPGGLLYLSTTNALCPKQQEFNLPMYSWYPAPLKRHYEVLSTTTRPELANFARYPAVHWFTYYGLRDYLGARGMACYDRFDLMQNRHQSLPQRIAIGAVRHLPPLRLLGHMLTAGTAVMALKKQAAV
jgi:2-polyprenyl-3-methyl-5-hydroxy-6-metoxy-1,4-benzoquinol methylase